MNYKFSRADSNQKQIVTKLRSVGCFVLHTHTLKNAFDILVGYKGKLYPVEIKADHKKKLEDGEQKCADDMALVGVKYIVITSALEFFEKISEL